jgi:shikimate kinase
MWSGDLALNDCNIVVTGFMGTGKTTVGRCIAASLQRQFIDTDEKIIEEAGKPISQIFSEDGEAAFRHIERRVCRFLAGQRWLVIATGGGMLIDESNLRVMMASGFVVCLNATPEEIRQRLAGETGRPLFSGDWESLLEKRRAVYAKIPCQIDTVGKTPNQIAQEIIELWQNAST